MSTRKHALLIGIDRYPLLGEKYSLEGCRRDVELMFRLLCEQYGFPWAKVLLDEEATRANILGAMEDLLVNLEKGDHVVFHFSGHGSQRARTPDEASGVSIGSEAYEETGAYEETIVPVDSGRGSGMESGGNRDIADREIRAWVRIVARKAAHVTWIFDCCHSGGLMRDRFSARARQAPRDDNPAAERSTPWADRGETIGLLAANPYTLLAACRPGELAFELPEERHGALTYFLARSLTGARRRPTSRDLYEDFCPWISCRFPAQHPIVEGNIDREPFGMRSARPFAFSRVTKHCPESLEVETGSMHGAKEGSRYLLYPPGTKTKGEQEPAGRIELVRVGAWSSTARLRESRVGSAPSFKGFRAVLESFCPGDTSVIVELSPALATSSTGRSLMERLRESPWLSLPKENQASIRLYGLEPRQAVQWGDPLPQLGPVDQRLLATCRDGELLIPLVPWDDERAADFVITSLERLARAWNVLAIENPRPNPELEDRVELLLWKKTETGWIELATDESGRRVCKAGDHLGIRIVNRSSRAVFPYLFDLGLTGYLSPLYPVPGAYEPLPAGQVLDLGMDPEEPSIVLQIPADLPFDSILGRLSTKRRRRTEHIKLFVSRRAVELWPLLQDRYWELDEACLGTLEHLLWRSWTGGEPDRLVRCSRKSSSRSGDDWTTVTRSFEVEY